jgi:DNA-binding response OmpR family regulator
MKVYKNGEEIQLSSKEIMIMKFFMENEGIVFTKDQLYNSIWNENVVGDNTIMVYIHHLRSKIEEDPSNPDFLKTVWGLGYKFQCD